MIRSMVMMLFIVFYASILPAQIEKYAQIKGKWKKGKLDKNSSVVALKKRRGGVASITILKNNRLIYHGANNCGFGAKRKGFWTLDMKKNILDFNYNEIIGYKNNKQTQLSTESEKYEIIRLNGTELIIRNMKSKSKLFFYR